MASRDVLDDREMALKILSSMIMDKVIPIATISQLSGIKYVDITRICTRLADERIVLKVTESSKIFYRLLVADYRSLIDQIYPPQPVATVSAPSLSSRENILKRRAARAAQEKAADKNVKPPTVAIPKRPERLSAVDLLAIKRSSASNSRVFDPGRSSTRYSAVNPVQSSEYASFSRPSSLLPAQNRTPDLRPVNPLTSSGSFKAVYVNKAVSKGPQNNRSSFTGMPPASLMNNEFERSDGSFKQRTDLPPKYQGPIAPGQYTTQNNSELADEVVREKLRLKPDDLLFTILRHAPHQEIWNAFSAIANSGGGVIILGMRKYNRDGKISYYIRSISSPETAIRKLFQKFNDRSIISDSPKDPKYIEIVEFGRKKVIAIHIQPDQLANAPVFTHLDSFNMKMNMGCYIYKNDQVVHCTEDEVKCLWTQKRLGEYKPDWNSESEIVPIEMKRNVKIKLPPVLDDAVRPLSRKECTYGQPIEQNNMPATLRRFIASNRGNEAMASMPDKVTANTASSPSSPYSQPSDNPSLLDTLDDSFVSLIQDGGHPIRRSDARKRSDNTTSGIQDILLAEDIQVSSVAPSAGLNLFASESQTNHDSMTRQPKSTVSQTTTSASFYQPELPFGSTTVESKESEPDIPMPPRYDEADIDLLKEIALPAINHTRLPAARLCEITVSLCKNARLKPIEISTLLNRKFVLVRDKIIPILKERPDIHNDNGCYYIQ